MSVEQGMTPLTDDELMAQGGTALPDKEVASVLDLNADLNLGISAAAPIDLGIAANANVAAPIDAGASANVLSVGSESQALADQGTIINQGVTGDATAAFRPGQRHRPGPGHRRRPRRPAASRHDGSGDDGSSRAVDSGRNCSGRHHRRRSRSRRQLPGGTTPDLGGALPTDVAGAAGPRAPSTATCSTST